MGDIRGLLQCVTLMLLCHRRHSHVVTKCNVTVLRRHSRVVTRCNVTVLQSDIHVLLQGVMLQCDRRHSQVVTSCNTVTLLCYRRH